jgi:kynurenine formamidase
MKVANDVRDPASGVGFPVGAVLLALAAVAVALPSAAQTREQGPWWPSPHGAKDQAGASNYVTPAKILAALALPKTGQTYELGHPYETSMPQYGSRPYFMNVLTRAATRAPGDPIVHTEYFTGYIGQMGTQFDALSHQGRYVRMADGSVEGVFYNGFTDTEMMGRTNGLGGVAALGVEHMKPYITRGVLIDIAGFKEMPTLPPAYEVTMADVRGALARQHMSDASIEQGDAVLFNFGWAVNWTNPSKYNDSFIGTGENQGSPGIGVEVANWLIERKVGLVGGDSCCVEVRGPVPKESVHHLLFLRHGIPLLENLDLAELARDETNEFLFLGLPERIRGATGSPIRPIAVR